MADKVPSFGLDPPVVVRNATLAVIRWRLAELLVQTRPGAPVLLYLTGHGGYVTNRHYNYRDIRPAPRRLHYFVTMPEAGGSEQGLFDVELSLWCARLARVSPNVVVVVDSCHSAGLVRDGDEDQAFIADFEAWRDAHQDEIDALDVEAHPDVVRLTAAGVNGVARPGASGSAFTTSLLTALAEEGALRSSWLALFARIEAGLARAGVAQEPRLSGPIRRRVFDLAVTLPPGAFVVRRDDDALVLAGGARHGVVVGDLFLVREADAEFCVEVDRVEATTATLRGFGGSVAAVQPSPAAFAVPLRLREGAATRSAGGPEVETVQRLARVERLQDLGTMALTSLDLRVSWGRVRDGRCEPLTGAAVEIHDTDRIYVRIENVGDSRRFISVFWISDDGEAAQLSRSESMGVELTGRMTYLLGDRTFTRVLRGVSLPRRPLAPGERRAERIVIVATTQRQTLWCFDTVSAASSRRCSADPAGTEMLRFTVSERPSQ